MSREERRAARQNRAPPSAAAEKPRKVPRVLAGAAKKQREKRQRLMAERAAAEAEAEAAAAAGMAADESGRDDGGGTSPKGGLGSPIVADNSSIDDFHQNLHSSWSKPWEQGQGSPLSTKKQDMAAAVLNDLALSQPHSAGGGRSSRGPRRNSTGNEGRGGLSRRMSSSSWSSDLGERSMTSLRERPERRPSLMGVKRNLGSGLSSRMVTPQMAMAHHSGDYPLPNFGPESLVCRTGTDTAHGGVRHGSSPRDSLTDSGSRLDDDENDYSLTAGDADDDSDDYGGSNVADRQTLVLPPSVQDEGGDEWRRRSSSAGRRGRSHNRRAQWPASSDRSCVGFERITTSAVRSYPKHPPSSPASVASAPSPISKASSRVRSRLPWNPSRSNGDAIGDGHDSEGIGHRGHSRHGDAVRGAGTPSHRAGATVHLQRGRYDNLPAMPSTPVMSLVSSRKRYRREVQQQQQQQQNGMIDSDSAASMTTDCSEGVR